MKINLYILCLCSFISCLFLTPRDRKSLVNLNLNKVDKQLVLKQKSKPIDKSTVHHEIRNGRMKYSWIEIAIAFHVVGKNLDDFNLSDSDFEKLLKELNNGFGSLQKGIEQEYINDAAIPLIRFVLASEHYNCDKIESISYHSNTPNTSFDFYEQVPTLNKAPFDKELKKHGYINSKKVLNIWICDLEGEKGALGYSTFPQEQNAKNDGVVIDFKVLKLNSSIKRIAITHEVGHYLGLLHTFEDGCFLPNDNVGDTPIQKGKNTYADVLNAKIKRLCLNPLKLSNFQNYMDYSYHGGMFTHGQVKRMRKQVAKYRYSLLQNDFCPEDSNLETNINGSKGKFKDHRDGKFYSWMVLGNNKWMTENLNYNSPLSVCYDNKEYNCIKYGRLYNWEEANNFCPKGWHLPTSKDWQELIIYLNNHTSFKNKGKWFASNNSSVNQLNLFTSGKKGPSNIGGGFSGLGLRTYYWQSNNYSPNNNIHNASSLVIYVRNGLLSNNSPSFTREKLSCRCIKNN